MCNGAYVYTPQVLLLKFGALSDRQGNYIHSYRHYCHDPQISQQNN